MEEKEKEEEEEETRQLNWKRLRLWGNGGSFRYKTQLCRRFRQGTCSLGSKCTFAHGVADLRRQQGRGGGIHQQQPPKLCRMFSQHKHCSYGHTCRFLHSTSSQTQTQTQTQQHHHHQFNNAPSDNTSHFSHAHAHGQPQPVEITYAGGGKHGGYSSAEHRVMQTSAAATNASTSKVATSSLHKNEQQYRVKRIFKENELQKISRIYADWI